MLNKNGLKERILESIDELKVYSHYCGTDVRPGKTIRSPLRDGDKNPSFNVFRTKDGRIMFKDFAGDSGDIFKFVMMIFNINFSDACKKIAYDFKIDTNPVFSKISDIKLKSSLIRIPIYEEKKEKEVTWTGEQWQGAGYFFIRSVHVRGELMNHYRFYRCLRFSLGKVNYQSKGPGDLPAFITHYPSGHVRFYNPLYSNGLKIKHLGTAGKDDVFGMEYLEERYKKLKVHGKCFDAIILCAGQKDTLNLAELEVKHRNIHHLPEIGYISLNSESCSLDPVLYLKLRGMTNLIYSIYDNDQTGLKYAQKLQDEYGIPSLISCYAGRCPGKDVSDAMISISAALQIYDNIKNRIIQDKNGKNTPINNQSIQEGKALSS